MSAAAVTYNAVITGSTEHVGMMDQVTKSAELIAPHCEQLGRLIFKCVCSIMP